MAENKRDYYEILGVARSADDAAIKKAYRTLRRWSIWLRLWFNLGNSQQALACRRRAGAMTRRRRRSRPSWRMVAQAWRTSWIPTRRACVSSTSASWTFDLSIFQQLLVLLQKTPAIPILQRFSFSFPVFFRVSEFVIRQQKIRKSYEDNGGNGSDIDDEPRQ